MVHKPGSIHMAAVRSLQRNGPQSLVQVFGRRLPVSGALAAALILFILAALGVGAVASAGSVIVTEEPARPLDAYTAIMPGQPLSAVEAFACGTAFPSNSSVSAFYCMIRPKDGPIRSISINGTKGKIESLTLRTSGIHVGDLIEHWGTS
jgi:hypothetical protein